MKKRSVGERKGDFLTFLEIIDVFTFYGIDVVLLAAATAVFTQLMKNSLFKRAEKKLFTFLPFVIGTLLYAIYAAVSNLSFFYLLDEFISVFEHGFSVGAVSTLIYILYEQFIRRKNVLSATESVISTLIEGYVPEDKLEAAAKSIAAAVKLNVTENGAARAQEILSGYAKAEINERDLQLLCKLIIKTLARLTVNK